MLLFYHRKERMGRAPNRRSPPALSPKLYSRCASKPTPRRRTPIPSEANSTNTPTRLDDPRRKARTNRTLAHRAHRLDPPSHGWPMPVWRCQSTASRLPLEPKANASSRSKPPLAVPRLSLVTTPPLYPEPKRTTLTESTFLIVQKYYRRH